MPIRSQLIKMQNNQKDKWSGSSSLLKSQPALFVHFGALRQSLLYRICKQKAPQTALTVISCFASWMGVIGTMCLHTKLPALSKAAKQIELGIQQIYPSERLSILASSHGWLIALIAAEAGLCFLFNVCVSTHFFPYQEMGRRWTLKQIKIVGEIVKWQL